MYLCGSLVLSIFDVLDRRNLRVGVLCPGGDKNMCQGHLCKVSKGGSVSWDGRRIVGPGLLSRKDILGRGRVVGAKNM